MINVNIIFHYELKDYEHTLFSYFHIFITYIFTDNFLSPILVSDSLVFCCGNLMLHEKKKNCKN